MPGPVGGVNSAPPDPSLDLREGNGQGKEQDGESMEGRGGNGWSERASRKGGRVGGCGGREGRRDRRSEGGRGGKKEGMEGMTGPLRFHNVDTPMMSGHVGLATTVWDRCSVKPEIHQNTCHQLVAWHSGRTSVSDWRTFPVLRLTCS